jgi:hypothetical protein
MSAFDDLPILRIPPGPTDDQIAFWNDLAYMRALLLDIDRAAAELRGETW